jgi:hypothetical protein
VGDRGATGGGRPKAPHPPTHFPFLHAWRGRLVTSPEKVTRGTMEMELNKKRRSSGFVGIFHFFYLTSHTQYSRQQPGLLLRVLPPRAPCLASNWQSSQSQPPPIGLGLVQMTPVLGIFLVSSRLQVVLPYLPDTLSTLSYTRGVVVFPRRP